MKEKIEPIESKSEALIRIEKDRMSIEKHEQANIPKSGTFFNYKIITLKELEQKNIDAYKAKHKL